MFKKDEVIRYIRGSLEVQMPDELQDDPAFVGLSDSDILLWARVGLARDFPTQNIDRGVEEALMYPLSLAIKREVYFNLATKNAPDRDLSAGAGVSLSNEQRFLHYEALIKAVTQEYDTYMDTNGGSNISGMESGGIKVGQQLIARDYFSERGRIYGNNQKVTLFIDNVYSNTIEVSFSFVNYKRFLKYIVYSSIEPIFDEYKRGIISSGAREEKMSLNMLDNNCRITGLVPNKKYWIGIIAYELNGNFAVDQLDVITEG